MWKVPGVTPAGALCGRTVDYANIYPTKALQSRFNDLIYPLGRADIGNNHHRLIRRIRFTSFLQTFGVAVCRHYPRLRFGKSMNHFPADAA